MDYTEAAALLGKEISDEGVKAFLDNYGIKYPKKDTISAAASDWDFGLGGSKIGTELTFKIDVLNPKYTVRQAERKGIFKPILTRIFFHENSPFALPFPVSHSSPLDELKKELGEPVLRESPIYSLYIWNIMLDKDRDIYFYIDYRIDKRMVSRICIGIEETKELLRLYYTPCGETIESALENTYVYDKKEIKEAKRISNISNIASSVMVFRNNLFFVLMVFSLRFRYDKDMGYVAGFHAIEEIIKSGAACGPLLMAKPGPRARELADLALSRRIRVDRVGTADLDRLAPDHRGIVLETADSAGNIPTLEGFLADLGDRKDALVLLLDEITDPHNYGAILRSCDQFAVDLVVSRRRRNAKNAAVVAQTSAGASAWVANAEEGNLARAVELLKEHQFWIYGADMGGKAAYTLDLTGRTALVMGGEAGLSRLLMERCDALAAIPSRGRIDSLNVSVAAGILLYETARQRVSQRKGGRANKGVKAPDTAPGLVE